MHTQVVRVTLGRERAGKSIGGNSWLEERLISTGYSSLRNYSSSTKATDERVLYKGKEVTIIQALSSSPAKLSYLASYEVTNQVYSLYSIGI